MAVFGAFFWCLGSFLGGGFRRSPSPSATVTGRSGGGPGAAERAVARRAELEQLLAERIVLLDGGTATELQRRGLRGRCYHGAEFRDCPAAGGRAHPVATPTAKSSEADPNPC